MKIDIFAHIMPQRYFKELRKHNQTVLADINTRNPSVLDLESRIHLMNRYPDVLQVLTVMQPALESLVEPDIAVDMAKMANDELAELVIKYPDKFVAAAACLPMNDFDTALEEADRAITQLGLKGVQIFATINGEYPGNPKFRPLFEKMAKYDLPIWIHPTMTMIVPEGGVFNLVFETTCAVNSIVNNGIINDFPDIKIIPHHCGAIVPLIEGRLWHKEQFRKLYGDTATYGSVIQLMCGYSFFGADHILFGTDAPLGPTFGCTMETIDAVEQMPITDEEREKIYYKNALKLLNISI